MKLSFFFFKYVNRHYDLNIFGVMQTFLNTKLCFISALDVADYCTANAGKLLHFI